MNLTDQTDPDPSSSWDFRSVNMNEDNLMCLNCSWTGHRTELVSTDDHPDSFIHCPDCLSSGDLESEDDGDEGEIKRMEKRSEFN